MLRCRCTSGRKPVDDGDCERHACSSWRRPLGFALLPVSKLQRDPGLSRSGDDRAPSFFLLGGTILELGTRRATFLPLLFSSALGGTRLLSWWLGQSFLDVLGGLGVCCPSTMVAAHRCHRLVSAIHDVRLCLVSAAHRPSTTTAAHRCRRMVSNIRRPSTVPKKSLGVL